MSRNNSQARKLIRKQTAYGNFQYLGRISLSERVRIIANRPGNSHRELSALLGNLYFVRPSTRGQK
jgi:hypothetical protein